MAKCYSSVFECYRFYLLPHISFSHSSDLVDSRPANFCAYAALECLCAVCLRQMRAMNIFAFLRISNGA